jgi:ribonuclease P protein component
MSSVKLDNPKKISGSLFVLKIAKNNLEISRFGFVISKKVDKSAVLRNSLKRKFSTSIEEIFDKIDVGWDFVFYPRSAALNVSKEKISEETRSILTRERLLND